MRIARGTPRKLADRTPSELADPLDHGCRHAGDSLAAPDEPHPLVGPELHAHLTAIQPCRGGDLLPHPVAIRTEARRLAHDRGVDRADRVAALRELVADLRQQVDAARVLPLCVA